MIRVGITGEMGSGKSFCSKLFGQLGIPVFNSDDVARTIVNSNLSLKEEIKKEFGEVYDDKGIMIPSSIRSIVFVKGAEDRLKKLNSLIHPYVFNNFNEFCLLKKSSPYIIAESAILFESGMDKIMDKIIYVSTDLELRIKRTFDRSGFSEEEYNQRMKDQIPNKEKISDYIIYNNIGDNVEEQVMLIHKSMI